MTVRFTPVVDPPQPDEYIFTVMPNGNLLLRFWAHQHCSFRLVLWIKPWLLVKCHCISQWIIEDDKCLPAEWCTLLSRLSPPWTSWTTSVMLLIPGTFADMSFLPSDKGASQQVLFLLYFKWVWRGKSNAHKRVQKLGPLHWQMGWSFRRRVSSVPGSRPSWY